jgi:hypothetical protein
MFRNNTSSTISSLTNLVSGLKKNPAKGSFMIAGTKYTAAQLVTIAQAIITALQAVGLAKGTYLKAVRSADKLFAQNRSMFLNLVQQIQAQAGDDTALLATYGLTPRKQRGKTTLQQKVAAADKSDATRAARHTMGKTQKKAITGATAPAAAPSASSPTAIAGNPALQTAVTTPLAGH